MKTYKTILADPPWEQKAGRKMSGKYLVKDGKQIFDFNGTKSVDLPYKTMTIQEICDLPIKALSDKDAVLFLWVTNKHLLNAAKVIEAWGFKYSTTLIWKKNPMGGGMGGTFKVSHEFLLYCTKGSVKSKKSIKGTVFDVKREYENGYPCHSRKPSFFQNMIEEVSHGDYLELFARKQRDGWDSWGNEIENSITI